MDEIFALSDQSDSEHESLESESASNEETDTRLSPPRQKKQGSYVVQPLTKPSSIQIGKKIIHLLRLLKVIHTGKIKCFIPNMII